VHDTHPVRPVPSGYTSASSIITTGYTVRPVTTVSIVVLITLFIRQKPKPHSILNTVAIITLNINNTLTLTHNINTTTLTFNLKTG